MKKIEENWPVVLAYVVFFVAAYSLKPVGEKYHPAVALFFNSTFAIAAALVFVELLKNIAKLISDRLAGRKEEC